MSNSGFHCPVPFYPDPGQSTDPRLYKKIYLVTGRNVVQPGAYGSWPSANAQYTGVADAASQSYKIWEELEGAWFADCERGDHNRHHSHGQPQSRSRLSSDLPTLSLRAPRSLPAATSPSAQSPSPPSPNSQPPALPCNKRSCTPPHAAACPPPHAAARTARPPPRVKPPHDTIAIPGKMVYVVRANGQGVVFDDFEQARGLYYQAQAQGHSASLACTPSLTDGVCWLEGFVVGQTSMEAARRRIWIGEEQSARQRRVTEGPDQVGYDWEASDSLSSDESDLSLEELER
ncbi:hypothetical protein C8R47DRAFT_1228408 [Mycena vitilis]|nr:hypothetical protein C8R47DRAFT_1228408 [Mycena vitilis]